MSSTCTNNSVQSNSSCHWACSDDESWGWSWVCSPGKLLVAGSSMVLWIIMVPSKLTVFGRIADGTLFLHNARCDFVHLSMRITGLSCILFFFGFLAPSRMDSSVRYFMLGKTTIASQWMWRQDPNRRWATARFWHVQYQPIPATNCGLYITIFSASLLKLVTDAVAQGNANKQDGRYESSEFKLFLGPAR